MQLNVRFSECLLQPTQYVVYFCVYEICLSV